MRQTMPGVSIILPTYNRADRISASIESVLEQSYRNFELIIVDDGSTDNTDEVVGRYQDSRICYHKMEQNRGQATARNYGMQNAKYDFIAFQDSDDLWLPRKLELQMKTMLINGPEVGISYHKMRYEIEGMGTIIMPVADMENCVKEGDIYRELLIHNIIGMPTLLVKKKCIEEVGMFDETMRSLEDYDFVLRLAKRYHAVFVDEVLLDASATDGGVSSNIASYLVASCTLVQKYKEDYLATGTLNYRLEKILTEAANAGIQDKVVRLLEHMLTT